MLTALLAGGSLPLVFDDPVRIGLIHPDRMNGPDRSVEPALRIRLVGIRIPPGTAWRSAFSHPYMVARTIWLLRPAMSLLERVGYVWVGAVWLAPGKDGRANVDELVWLVTYVPMVSPLGRSPEPLTMAWKPAGADCGAPGASDP